MKFRVLLVSFVTLTAVFFLFSKETRGEVKEVKIGIGPAGVIGYMPTYVARDLGYFKDLEKEGLKVTLVNFKGGPPAGLALLGGDVEFANIVLSHVIKAKEQGKDLKFLLTFFNSQVMAMIAQGSLKDINSPKDLKGKKIGITALGSATHMQARHILRHYGIDPNDVFFVPVGAGEVVGPWKQKAIDALVHLDPWISDFIEDGSGKMLFDVRSVEKTKELYGAEHISSGLLARADYVAKNPEVVQKIVHAYVKALRWLSTKSPEQVEKVVSKDLNWKLPYIKYNMPGLSPNGLVVKKGVETVIKYLKEDKLLAADFNVPVETLYENRFVENALKGM